MTDGSPHLYIIEDTETIRNVLVKRADERGMEVSGFGCALDFLLAFEAGQPGCILADVKLPDADGIEVYKRVRKKDGAIPFILMTGYASVPLAVEVMKLGATDFFEKPFDVEDVLDAAYRAMDDSLKRHESLEALTGREQDVLALLAAGHTNKVIGNKLGIVAKTVEVHRANLMRKLGANDLSEVIRFHQSL